MRPALLVAALLLVACTPKTSTSSTTPPAGGATPTEPKPDDADAAATVATMTADTPSTTHAGHGFVAPKDWRLTTRGPVRLLEAPEGDSRVAIVDLEAKDADEAVAKAWKLVDPKMAWKLQLRSGAPDKDGWTKIVGYAYDVPPKLARGVGAQAMFAGSTWTVVLIDIAAATAEKRGSQLGVMLGRLLPKGVEVESFAGKKAHPLDEARLAEITKFVEHARTKLGVEGVGLGIIDGGKVVFAGGFGVRELGKPAKVDAKTKFLVASNTKALTTLMLAKLVDEGKLTWDATATSLMPSFALGDAATTAQVKVEHLICACTGMPRQDLEWLVEFDGLTPAGVMKALGGMQPTSGFGELFQYSNVMAAAAGFIGGHVAFPKLELGKAYDQAMRTRVFGPLGMKDTTFDFGKAMRGNVARAHGLDVDAHPALAVDAVNRAVIPVRPAGGAWSTVDDMLAYVQMELSRGKLPDGSRYISEDALLARRRPQIAVSDDTTYGMGLMVSQRHGIPVVSHGGDLIGFHSDMIWLPEAGVGLVILTNSDRGVALRGLVQRKLLEVLYDGKSEAEPALVAGDENFVEAHKVQRATLVVPADPAVVATLAQRYRNEALGALVLRKRGTATILDVGEWSSEIATRKNPDGTVSIVTTSAGIGGIDLLVTEGGKGLVLRDAQHEYAFVAE